MNCLDYHKGRRKKSHYWAIAYDLEIRTCIIMTGDQAFFTRGFGYRRRSCLRSLFIEIFFTDWEKTIAVEVFLSNHESAG